ncbi:MAG: nucleotidyltransferase family protein [Clostridia bacterium]
MRIAGIIAEYNPFHNGHAYHARMTREMSGCDCVVAVMSGAFTQRGEPALVDKWARAEMALCAGVDVVIELPALFAMRPADHFALGGVSILAKMGVDVLSFGCETDDLPLLDQMSRALEDESDALSADINARLAQGMSHARARGEALQTALNLSPEVVSAPNTVLALEYLTQNRRLKSPLQPLVIARRGGYHDARMGEMASASAIRAALKSGRDVACAVPETTREMLEKSPFSHAAALDNLLLNTLRTMRKAQLAGCPEVAEGLEGRIKRCAEQAIGRSDLMDKVKCKRYTMARISRILNYALLGVDERICAAYPDAPYARVLGFREAARPALREMKARATLPIVTRCAALRGEACFELERRATDLWGLTCDSPEMRTGSRDLTERVRIIG